MNVRWAGHRTEIVGVAAAAVATGAIVFWVTGRLPASMWSSGNDIWFEGDLATVTRNLTDRWSDQSRNANHPLYPLLGTVPVYAIRTTGAPPLTAIRIMLAVIAALWIGLTYLALRLCGRPRIDAAVFTGVALSSAAALGWLIVPECVGLASVSVLVALALAGWSSRAALAPALEVAASAFTLSVTVTNWMAGLLLSFSRLPLRRALQISGNALCVVVVLWAVQRQLFPTADFFIGYSNYQRFVLRPESGGPIAVGRVFLVHSMVMPELRSTIDPKWGATLTIQHSRVGSAGPVATVATVCWLALLGLGAAGLRRAPRPVVVLVVGMLAAQYALHVVFGEETFLYTLHFIPLLVVTASYAAATRARAAVLAVAGLLAVLASINNVQQIRTGMAFMAERSPGIVRPLSPTCLPISSTPSSPEPGER